MLYNMKKVHVLSEISPKELLVSNGDKQLRHVSVINFTIVFKFHETPIKSHSS